MKETLFRRSVQDDRGKEKREHGSIQKETKYIGPSLRAIKPGWETLLRRSVQDDRGEEKREHGLHSEGDEMHRSFASRYKAKFGKHCSGARSG